MKLLGKGSFGRVYLAVWKSSASSSSSSFSTTNTSSNKYFPSGGVSSIFCSEATFSFDHKNEKDNIKKRQRQPCDDAASATAATTTTYPRENVFVVKVEKVLDRFRKEDKRVEKLFDKVNHHQCASSA